MYEKLVSFNIFPLEGNFDFGAGDGWWRWWWVVVVVGGYHLGPPNSQNISNKSFVRKLFTLLGIVPS